MFGKYREEHPGTTYSVSSFRTHCSSDLGLTFRYTKEQDDFLRENYPHLGAKETQKRFLEVFGINRGIQGLRTRCTVLGLHETPERKTHWRAENGRRRALPVGSTHISEGGVKFVKTKNGWKRESKAVYGDIPKDHYVVHLDGDKDNNEKQNLAAVSRQTSAKMTAYRFWNDNPVITKTAIMCCELENLIQKGEVK